MAGKDTVAEIKERLTIQDVVAPYVKLNRAGRSLTGLCPFHKEKTPSFHVSTERGTFHCFGCGVGGDMFSFIEKIEGVDFKGALKMLADKAGVEIEYSGASREHRDRQERLREAMTRAAQIYATGLTKESPAYAYATKRGLSEATITSFGLGVAPDAWRDLLERLTSEGFTTQELLAAGLIKEAEGKSGTYYDRFRNRLMFPIRDVAGRVVAFTGRALADDELAKYLNSPETELYHKSDVLFGMDRAKEAIRVRGFTLLVEGQMDLLHAHQAGFGNTVALSGTALTPKHLMLMKRYSDNLMLVLDADTAGLAATAKSAQLALREGLRVKAVRLPPGKDPADLIMEDVKDFTARIKDAKPVIEFFLAELTAREREQHRLVLAAERVVMPLIRAVQSPLERDHFMQLTARFLGLSTEAVREAVGRVEAVQSVGEAPQKATGTPWTHLDLIRAIATVYAETPLATQVISEYSRITEAPLPAGDLPDSILFEAEKMFGEDPAPTAADELLHAFEIAVVREAYQERVTELRRAEAAGDTEAILAASKACQALQANLAALGR